MHSPTCKKNILGRLDLCLNIIIYEFMKILQLGALRDEMVCTVDDIPESNWQTPEFLVTYFHLPFQFGV